MFSAKTIARLFFYPALLLVTLLCLAPIIWTIRLAQQGTLPILASVFFTFVALSLFTSLYLASLHYLRRWAAKVALRYQARRVEKRGCKVIPITSARYAAQLREQSSRADWNMLSGLSAVLVLAAALLPAGVRAQPQSEGSQTSAASSSKSTVLPVLLPNTTVEQRQFARQLQNELRLNEYGVIRALKYLRQNYTEQEVRNLFASTVRK